MSICRDCEFGESCLTNKIESFGPDKAKIMVVLEHPSISDDRSGELLSGDIGAKLSYLFELAGFKQHKIHFTSAVKCAPPFKKKPAKKHVKACNKYLMSEILRVRPEVIISMGNISLMAILDQTGISDFRGFFDKVSIPYTIGNKTKKFKTMVMPTFTAGACLAKWENDSIFLHDLKKVKEYLQTGHLDSPPEVEYKVVTSLKSLTRVTEELCELDLFSFDFETTGFLFHKHQIIMAGFGVSAGKAYIIPTRSYLEEESKKWQNVPEEEEFKEKINVFVNKYSSQITECLKKIFASKAKKIAHNGKFDASFAKKNKFKVSNFFYDTMVAHALIDENKPHNLTFCADWYRLGYGNYEKELWPWIGKDPKKRKPYSYAPPLTLAKYLAYDVDATFRLYRLTVKDLKKEGMVDLMMKQQMPLTRCMTDMEYEGIKIDVPRLQDISRDFTIALAAADKKVKKLTQIDDFNMNSPKQLGSYLEEIGAIGNVGDKKTGSGSFSTDASVLERLACKNKMGRVPRLILESRAITKLKSNYLDGKSGEAGLLFFVDKSGFVHYNSNIHTPRTGRMSVNNPAIQTIPRPNPKYPKANIRQLFIPSQKGWFIWSVDFKQLEMRIAAHLSKDPVLTKEIQDGVDIHSRNAVTLATRVGMLPEGLTEEKFLKAINYEGDDPGKLERLALWAEVRTLTKALGFGLNYGMTARTLSKDHGTDEDVMQDMIDCYFEKYHVMYDWRLEQMRLAVHEGLMELPVTGRKRRFHDASRWFASEYSQDIRMRSMDIEAIERQAMNFPIQGLANEYFVRGKLALIMAMKKAQMQARSRLSLHDGILGDAPKSELCLVKELAEENLQTTIGKGKYKIDLSIDFDIYDRWSGNKFKLSDVI